MKAMKTLFAGAAMMVAAAMVTPAMAQEFPLVAGDYAEVGGIFVKDGGTLKYAMHIAGDWKKNQEFAKSQGWITGYKIYINENPRDGEPNVYLMTTFASLARDRNRCGGRSISSQEAHCRRSSSRWR